MLYQSSLRFRQRSTPSSWGGEFEAGTLGLCSTLESISLTDLCMGRCWSGQVRKPFDKEKILTLGSSRWRLDWIKNPVTRKVFDRIHWRIIVKYSSAFNGFKLVCQGRQDRQRLSRCNLLFQRLAGTGTCCSWDASFFIFLKSAKCDILQGMQCLLGFFSSVLCSDLSFALTSYLDVFTYILIFSINIICTCVHVRKTFFANVLKASSSTSKSVLLATLTAAEVADQTSGLHPTRSMSTFFVSAAFMQRS